MLEGVRLAGFGYVFIFLVDFGFSKKPFRDTCFTFASMQN